MTDYPYSDEATGFDSSNATRHIFTPVGRFHHEAIALNHGGEAAQEPGEKQWLTSWSPDLTEGTVTGPEKLRRADGEALLYVGKLHWLQGEPESGKTWLALAAAAEALSADGAVLFVDFEDSRAGVLERLEAMGAPTEKFVYMHPDEAFSELAETDIQRLMTELSPSVVILDGVNEAMALEGLDPIRNQDTAKFVHRVLDKFRGPEITTIVIDHVARGESGKGRYAYGSQHKLAAVDGAAYRFEAIQAFSRAQGGASRIDVVKDRPGWVRSFAHGKDRAGVLRVVPGDVLAVTVEPIEVDGDGDDLNYTQRRVLNALPTEQEGGLGYSQLGDRLASDGKGHALKRTTIRAALDILVEKGLADGARTVGRDPSTFWKISG